MASDKSDEFQTKHAVEIKKLELLRDEPLRKQFERLIALADANGEPSHRSCACGTSNPRCGANNGRPWGWGHVDELKRM